MKKIVIVGRKYPDKYPESTPGDQAKEVPMKLATLETEFDELAYIEVDGETIYSNVKR